MQVSRSLPSSSSISDLKNLIDFLSDAGNIKSGLNDMNEKIKELKEAELSLNAKKDFIEALEKKTKQLSDDILKQADSVEKEKAEHKAAVDKFNAYAAEHHSEAKKLKEDIEDFNKQKQNILEELDKKNYAAEQKYKEACELDKKASAMKIEFETKLEKIKSI